MSRTPLAADFASINAELTNTVVGALDAAGRHSAVIAEAPPGAGKSSLTVSVAHSLVTQDATLRLPVITQTNEQADDLVTALVRRHPQLRVARLVGGGSKPALGVPLVGHCDEDDALRSQIVIGTARKWEYERARLARSGVDAFPFGLIDEAYQMRSDSLLGIADLYETLFCVGDPGQLDPFVTVDDSLWKGLVYSPARSALAVLRGYHQDLDPIRLSTSWRLPPHAAGIVSAAFYPNGAFSAGTAPGQRSLSIAGPAAAGKGGIHLAEVLQTAAGSGWAYVELPEAFTVRTDQEIAATLAGLVKALLDVGANVVDELHPDGVPLGAARLAVIAAHNDQVFAVRYELAQLGVDPDSVVVSTANKIQGREYDVTFVWHPLAGRRDATAFHLESGRMCVMLSRHRHACVVVGRAGADRLLAEFPDSDPVFLDEPEKFPDGWEANYQVLEHLKMHRV